MSAIVCPTVTVETPQEYTAQIERVASFASRIHIDIADGSLAPRKLLPLSQVYLPDKLVSDIHVMVKDPAAMLMTLISLRPHLVVLHAEADGDIAACLTSLQQAGIKAGIALLPETSVQSVTHLLQKADHALVFAGKLGYQGGEADLDQLHKVTEIKAINPDIEIAWDGGINDTNASQLTDGGVQVLNVGGYIQQAENPSQAYNKLLQG